MIVDKLAFLCLYCLSVYILHLTLGIVIHCYYASDITALQGKTMNEI